jgi:hypothetical protein
MNEEEKMQAAKQMSSQERDEIMSSAASINNSIDEPMDQTLLQKQSQNTTLTTNTEKGTLRTGSFVGVGDGIHNAEGRASVIPLHDRSNILRLEN